MRRSLALVSLFAALAVAAAAPGRVNPAEANQHPVPEKGLPPTILSPQPGDVVTRIVTVTGTSDCWPVMLTWTPPGTTPQPVAVNPIPGTNTWTYTITDSPRLTSIKACCKQDPPPHFPCYEVGGLAHAIGVALKAQPPEVTAVAPGPGIPTYRLGRIDLSHAFPYEAGRRQSVYVVVESAALLDPGSDRSQAAKADVVPPAAADAAEAEWRTCFTVARPGFYLVRATILSRGAAAQSQSYVIRVVP